MQVFRFPQMKATESLFLTAARQPFCVLLRVDQVTWHFLFVNFQAPRENLLFLYRVTGVITIMTIQKCFLKSLTICLVNVIHPKVLFKLTDDFCKVKNKMYRNAINTILDLQLFIYFDTNNNADVKHFRHYITEIF